MKIEMMELTAPTESPHLRAQVRRRSSCSARCTSTPLRRESAGSPDYMDTREEDEKSRSSSSSSDDEEVRVEEEVKAEEMAEERTEVEPEPEVQVKVEEVNGEAHDGSRRSSASSSASSASPGDPCDDPPIQPRILEEDNANDVMLMTNLNTDTSPDGGCRIQRENSGECDSG
ncbi:hypothetical protein E3U43_017253 [Larimichthys crocea]|uniref:Uncharacterized protein n=1 Tax=Larimichthys crocea TaxID=215358 RepID=A0ACD3QYT2_LARCR|nr:hypothetical protein E3U43_017253 [Larimichthys crocea]